MKALACNGHELCEITRSCSGTHELSRSRRLAHESKARTRDNLDSRLLWAAWCVWLSAFIEQICALLARVIHPLASITTALRSAYDRRLPVFYARRPTPRRDDRSACVQLRGSCVHHLKLTFTCN